MNAAQMLTPAPCTTLDQLSTRGPMLHAQSVADDRLVMSTTLANGLLYAAHKDLGLMRKVYALCAQQGVYPEVSQFNRLMDWYTEQGRFGEVVSLVCDMVGAGLVSAWACRHGRSRSLGWCMHARALRAVPRFGGPWMCLAWAWC